jgi:hypothetical protein
VRKGTFYLARFHKTGIDNSTLFNVLRNPSVVSKGQHAWTFTKYKAFPSEDAPLFVYARLAKFDPDGEVSKVDTSEHDEVNELIDNKVVASSPFVYIPEFSGVAYLHIWNQIQKEAFIARFPQIILHTLKEVFVNCYLDPIADYEKFVYRLAQVDALTRIRSKVTPPNPLFGSLWESLRDHLKRRDLKDMVIDEHSKDSAQIKSSLIKILREFTKDGQLSTDAIESLKDSIDISDAAVLMAADGYGQAKIEGKRDGQEVEIKTSESIKGFKLSVDPKPEQLYEAARKVFQQINNERYLKHQ